MSQTKAQLVEGLNINTSAPADSLVIDSSGKVGIGTTSPAGTLDVRNADSDPNFYLYNEADTSAQRGNSLRYGFSDGIGASVRAVRPSAGSNTDVYLSFGAGGDTERARIDSSGRLLIGTDTSTALNLAEPAIQVVGTDQSKASILIRRSQNTTGGPAIRFASSDGTIASPTPVAANDVLGLIRFQGYDGSSFDSYGAEISCVVDGGVSAGDMPGKLVFSTTADGNPSPTERMSLSNDGRFYVPGVWDYSTSGGTTVVVTSDDQIRKAASSLKYKTDIEDLQDSYADQILNIRPVWYRSLCDGDDPAHSYWGFIAEEVAEIDPRLTTWKFHDVSYDENGSRVVTKLDNPEPEGVAYDRFVPHLLNLIKRQKEQIEAMEVRLSALESQ